MENHNKEEEINNDELFDETKESKNENLEVTLNEYEDVTDSLEESTNKEKLKTEEKSEGILNFINSISAELSIRNERDKYKDETIIRISKELSDYQQGMLEKIKEGLIKEILSFYNAFLLFQNKFSNSDNQNLISNLDYLETELSNILFNNGIDEIELIEGDTLDRTYQKIKIKTPTEDISKDNLVCAILKKGFIWNDKVIQKQEVEIFIYNKKSEDE